MSHTLHLIQNVLLGVVVVLAVLALFSGFIARRVTRAFPPEGRFVDVGGDRIHYVEYGSGPPLVFVHGLAGQWRTGEEARTPEASRIFHELGLTEGARRRQLLESESFRALLAGTDVELPLPQAA